MTNRDKLILVTCSVSFVKSLGIRGSTIGLAGSGIWLFFVVILGMQAKKKEREAGILIMSRSGISYFFALGCGNRKGKVAGYGN